MQELDVAVAQDMGELGRGAERADGGDERADAQAGEEGGDKENTVRSEQADARAFAGAGREQSARAMSAGDWRSQFLIGEGSRAA